MRKQIKILKLYLWEKRHIPSMERKLNIALTQPIHSNHSVYLTKERNTFTFFLIAKQGQGQIEMDGERERICVHAKIQKKIKNRK